MSIVRISLYIGIFYTLLACESPNGIGSNILDKYSESFLLDTSTLVTSTVVLDSIPTSGKQIALIGNLTSQKLGITSAKSFAMIGLNGSFVPDKKAVYDSLVLFLNYKTYFGDTTQTLSFNIHPLVKKIEFKKDQSSFYHFDSWVYDDNFLLGNVSFKPRPKRGKPLQIRLRDDFGRELFELATAESSILDDTEDFLAYFPGIALVEQTGNNCLLGFDAHFSSTNNSESQNLTESSGFFMRLYYKEEGEKKQYDFPITQSTLQFNQIQNNKANTFFSSLLKQSEALSTTQTLQEGLIQGGNGLFLKVEIPHLDKYLELGNRTRIVYAELVIRPIKGTYQNENDLPNALNMYLCNRKNQIIGILSANDQGSPITASLNIDKEFKENTKYVFDLTNYVLNELATAKNSNRFLLIGLPSSEVGQNFNTLVLGGAHHPKNAIQLRVIATTYY